MRTAAVTARHFMRFTLCWPRGVMVAHLHTSCACQISYTRWTTPVGSRIRMKISDSQHREGEAIQSGRETERNRRVFHASRAR
jgi:hypothetical protein